MLNNALQRMFNLIARSSETVSASRRSRGRKSRHIEALEQRALLAGNPFVQSIVRANAAPATTSGTSAVFEVTFSEPVTGVDSADFQVVTTGSTTVASTVSVSPISTSVYNVTASGIFGAGTVKLNLVDDLSIRDASNLGLVSSSISFQSQQQFASGATPDKVEVADLNGDGFLDVVTPNEGPNRVGVFIGNGDGTFQAQVQYVTGAGPRFVKIADFNADGKPDLAVANRSSSSNTIGILLGNGNGTFQTQVTYAAGSNPEALDIGDINGDGKLDIVVVNLNNNVGVFRGNGNGTFQAMVTTATGTAPRSVALADVDADGDLDVVTGNSTANTVTVLKNNGSGTLTVSGTFGTGATPLAVALRDLNGDNRPDIAVANSGSATVGVLLNTGTGAFGTQTSLAVGTTPSSVATQDINGDGKLDLAVANFGSNTVSVLAGNGSGGFATQQPFGVGAGPNGVALADLNNDGKLDLLSANATASTISSVLNNNGSYTNGQTYTVLGQVVSTSFMASGTLTSGVSSMTVTFNGPLVGIGTASNYQLQAAGSDGLLLTTDSVVSPTSVTVSGSNVTLNFASLLVEDVYRLTVKDTITDSFGIELDGDGNGTAGGDWRRDFVVGALSATLSSTDGSFFDLRFSGSSPGQIVQGSRNAFDGLNQLQIGGIQYSPIETSPPSAVRVEAVTGPSGTDFSVPIGSFGSVPGLSSSITATSSAARFAAEVSLSVYLPSGGAVTYFEVAIFVDGIQGKTRLIEEGPSLGVGAPGWVRVSLDDLLALSVGGHTIDVRARQLGGSPVVIDNTANTNTLAITRFEPIAASQPSAVRVEAVTGPSGTDFSVPIGSFGSVPGLSSSITATSSAARFAAEVSLSVYLPSGGAVTYFEVAIFVDGIQGKTRLIEEGPSLGVGAPGWVRVSLDDLLALSVGGHTIDVRARQLGGSPVVIDNTANTNTLAITRFEPIAASQPSAVRVEAVTGPSGTDFSVPIGSFGSVPGLSSSITATSSAARFAAEVSLSVYLPSGGAVTYFEVAIFVDGIQGKTRLIEEGPSLGVGAPGWVRVSLDDLLALSVGGHTIDVRARQLGGSPVVIDNTANTNTLAITRFEPIAAAAFDDGMQTVVTQVAVHSGLTVNREVTVPIAGTQNFARTVEVFTNPTGSTISVPVRVAGNLGSDAATTVFATSDGDTIVEPTDWWFGTDDADGTGTPAVIHLLHGPRGLSPASVNVLEDNVDWTYNLPVAPGETKRLATFTILGNTRAEAIAAVNSLVNVNGFGGEAAAFLTQSELDSLANFQFNQAPTSILVSPAEVAENQPAGTIAGTLTTSDPNPGDTFVYSLVPGDGSSGNSVFMIEADTIKTTESFDFEAQQNYSIRVRSTDQNGLFVEQILTIVVTNVNEAPADVSLTGNSFSENAGANFVIGTLSAVDPDAGETITYSLPSNTANNNQFNINGTSLRASNSFDFETGSTYSITVRATDAGGLSFDKSFTITVTNVNESPTDISLPNTLVAENLPTGTNVGSFQTVDPDSGNTFTYALLTGTGSDHNANFTIVGDTLKTATTFNFEGQSSYSIRVRSTDQNGLYVEKVFTIQITNVTELGGIDTQLGQTQRSYVRYLDVLFDRPDDIMSMVNNGRFQLTRMDLNGLNPSGVALSPGMFSAVGNSARLDFGVNGLGGNRNTTAGDGYYELGVDMDGNGSYESKKYFYRLLGDVNGDRKVDSTDSSLVTSAFGTTNPDRDVNGDGTVNANDRTLVLRSIGRKLKDDLFADD